MDSAQQKGSNYDSQPKNDHSAYVSINVQLNEFIFELMLGEDPEDPIVEFEEDRRVLNIPEEYDSYEMSNHGFLYQIYSEKINLISDNFNETFFNKLEDKVCVNELTQFLIRDKNELWKFMFFLFSCLKHVEVEKECFQSKPLLTKPQGSLTSSRLTTRHSLLRTRRYSLHSSTTCSSVHSWMSTSPVTPTRRRSTLPSSSTLSTQMMSKSG